MRRRLCPTPVKIALILSPIIPKFGTENLIRIMVEGKNQNQIQKIADEIGDKIINN
jgi:hypothetical protein